MHSLKREVLNEESSATALSFWEDVRVSRSADYSTARNSLTTTYSYTVAVGNGSSYVYPRAMFIGSKQVYPPIVKSDLCGLVDGGNREWRINLSSDNIAFITYNSTNPTYLFPGVFRMTVGHSTSSSYSSYNIPSFNPATESSSTQYAYLKGNYIYLKDPRLPQLPPNDITQYTTLPTGSNAVVTHLAVSVSSVASALKTAYGTAYAPLAYNKMTSNPQILRRQFLLDESALTISTSFTSSSNQTNYYDIYAASNNAKITDSNPIKLIPKKDSLATQLAAFGPGNNYEMTDPMSTQLYGDCSFMSSVIMDVFFVNRASTINTSYVARWVKHKTHDKIKSAFTQSTCSNYDGFKVSLVSSGSNPPAGKPIAAVMTDTKKYLGNYNGFNIYSVPNSYTTNWPALNLTPTSTISSFTSYTYSSIITGSTGVCKVGDESDFTSWRSTIIDGSYFLTGNISYVYDSTVFSTSTSNASSGTVTYFNVAAIICVPVFYGTDDNRKFGLASCLVMSDEHYYTKRRTSASSTYTVVIGS